MANRVPLIADSSTLFLKELPSGDALDLTGCSIVGLTSFTPGTGGGYRFVGITTFGDGAGTGVGAGKTGVYFNDGLQSNYLKATNLTADRVVLTGAGGTLTDSSDLTFSASTLTAANVTITGDTNLGNASGDTITATGSFDSHLIPASDGDKNLGSSSKEWGDLYIDGTANIDALVADTAKISDITDNHVVIGGSAGELEGSSNLTFDGSTLTVTGNLDVSGSLNYTNVTDIYSVGIITANGGIIVSAGFVTCSATDNSTSTSTGVLQVAGGAGIVKNLNVGLEVKSEDLNITGISTLNDTKVGGGLTVTGAADLNSTLDVASTSTLNDDVTFTGATKNIVWDKSDQQLEINGDASNVAKVSFGDSHDLQIYKGASSGNAFIHNAAGTLNITQNSGTVKIAKNTGDEMAYFNVDGSVQLYHNSSERFATTDDGADISGTASLKIPVGTTAQRNASPADGDIRYNSDLNSYEGYGNSAWGGLGGGTEIDNKIATASATGVGTFAKASYRSASIRAQINQGGSYQVGRYLLIHDGTTVTVVEEAAIATGSMLGSFDGVINGSNVEFKVTMVSAGIATVTTIIDKISV